MNVEIGAEAALFPEKKYINGIAVAVCSTGYPLPPPLPKSHPSRGQTFALGLVVIIATMHVHPCAFTSFLEAKKM